MTLNELKKEVLALMFENEFDSHEALVFSVNRALVEIHSEKARLETLKIHKNRIVPNEYYAKLSHEAGNNLTITLKSKSLSFTAVGTGELFLKDGAKSELISFSGTNVEIKRKINTGSAHLSFQGDFDYDIFELAGFNFDFGENIDDIPCYSPLKRYDMRKIDPNFLAFASSVTDSQGQAIFGLKLEGSLIFVPTEYEGDLVLSYKRMPRKIGEDELDAEIDIAPECEHLLALRIAAYLLLDGNEGLAEYYLSLYRSGINTLKNLEGRGAGEKFLDVLGWA